MEISQIMLEYLRYILCDDESVNCKEFLNEEQLHRLYSLSKKHDLAALVADALDKKNVLRNCEAIRKKFLLERNMAVFRYEQMQYEIDGIFNALQKGKIAFIPLKGAVIRRFYPEPWMRTSCDIDILVNKNDLKNAISILETNLSYRCDSVGEYDAQLYAENGVHLELHYSLTESTAKVAEQEIFHCVWENTEGNDYHKSMSDAMFYCYHMSHIAKHLIYGGCGVRAILDTWILNKKVAHNRADREILLRQAGLLSTAKAIENLAAVWFSNKDEDELSERLGNYILTGGVYGSFDNKVAAQQSRKKNKFTYLISRLFLPYSQMKFKYPKLQKWPILYPFYIVKRMFLLFKKDTKARVTHEVNETMYGDLEKQKGIAKLMKDLDL